MEGDPEQELHLDAPLVPEPLPVVAVSSNSMWITNDFTMEIRSTTFVPGSHKRLCSPPADAREMAVPVLAKKGSVIFLVAIFGMELERGLSPGSGLE